MRRNITRFIPIYLFILLSGSLIAQGFETTAINWGAPNGGYKEAGTTYGFYKTNETSSGSDNGSQIWSLIDMDGDSRPDLVVTGQKQGVNTTSFSPTSSQYWKVYINNGSGFSTTAINWGCPAGGYKSGGITYGFLLTTYTYVGSDNGTQLWTLKDMDGDNRPDLVVTAQKQGTNATSFSPTSSQYWKVYINNGSGFSTTATNWGCPAGGYKSGGITYGFLETYGIYVGSDNGTQLWTLNDINGDAKPDLIVTAQKQGTNTTSFSPTSSQYWKVYINNGSGFSTTAINWGCPAGGYKSGGITYGFLETYGINVGSDNGTQLWTLNDLNGDAKPDLIVTAQKQGTNTTSFSPASSQYWKVYINNGSGFSTTATNWGCPAGGYKESGINYGFWKTYGVYFGSDNGSQLWTLNDIDGDAKPDLIVTGQKQGVNTTSFSPTSSQYWKVYINNGSEFSTTATNWGCPDGGFKQSGIECGYRETYGIYVGTDNGSQLWETIDMNGDSKPDLVVSAQKQGANTTSFSPTSNQYWKVYLNQSTVSIEEKILEESTIVYPNPFVNSINITSLDGDKKISLYDQFGKILKTYKIQGVNEMIQVDNIPVGTYLLVIEKEGHSIARKIIKTE